MSWTHFEIPDSWAKFRACDYGYGSYTGVLWFAVAPDEQVIVYREMYVSKVTASDLADLILEAEAKDGTMRYGVLDSSLWHNRGDTGPSLAEQMNMKGVVGVRLTGQEAHVSQVRTKYIGVYR